MGMGLKLGEGLTVLKRLSWGTFTKGKRTAKGSFNGKTALTMREILFRDASLVLADTTSQTWTSITRASSASTTWKGEELRRGLMDVDMREISRMGRRTERDALCGQLGLSTLVLGKMGSSMELV